MEDNETIQQLAQNLKVARALYDDALQALMAANDAQKAGKRVDEIRTRKSAKTEGLQLKKQKIADARMEILATVECRRSTAGISFYEAAKQIVKAYPDRGITDLNPNCYELIQKISVQTVLTWRNALDNGGREHLIPGWKGRTRSLETDDPRLTGIIEDLLGKMPTITGRQLHAHLLASGSQDDLIVPSLRTCQRIVAKRLVKSSSNASD